MPNLTLVEYWINTGAAGEYEASGNSFTFDPQPVSLVKEVKVKWRIRRPGYKRKIERARFRFNETIQFKLTGSCTATKRDELEWYAKRDSLFKVANCEMKTYHATGTSDSRTDEPPTYQDAVALGEDDVFVIITDAKFTQREGKVDWFDYTVTLRRVHLTRH